MPRVHPARTLLLSLRNLESSWGSAYPNPQTQQGLCSRDPFRGLQPTSKSDREAARVADCKGYV